MGSKEWYCLIGSTQRGPYTDRGISKLFESGDLSGETLVSNGGDWIALKDTRLRNGNRATAHRGPGLLGTKTRKFVAGLSALFVLAVFAPKDGSVKAPSGAPTRTQQPATANPDGEKRSSERAIPSTAANGRVPLDEVRRRFDLSSYANASLHDRVTVLTDSKVFKGFPTTDETHNSEVIKAISVALKRSDYQDLIACSALGIFMEPSNPGMLKAAAGISLISKQMSSEFGFGNADEAMLRSAKNMPNRRNQELRDMMVKCGKLMVLGAVLIP